MKRISIIFLLIFQLSLSLNTTAQISTQELSGRVNTITSAVPFLMITPDSRAGGMGEMGVASSPDANSQYWNAAKYSFIKDDFGISMSYTPWLQELVDDIHLLYLSGYKKFKKGKAFGASLRYFSLGHITFTDLQGGTIRAALLIGLQKV